MKLSYWYMDGITELIKKLMFMCCVIGEIYSHTWHHLLYVCPQYLVKLQDTNYKELGA